MKYKIKNYIVFFLCIIFLLTSCSLNEDKIQTIEVPYTVRQMRMMILSQIKRVDDAYTDAIWDREVTEDGRIYSDVFLEQMKQFFLDLAVISSLASDDKQILDTEEKKQLSEIEDAFYESSIKTSAKLVGMSKSDVAYMFEQYLIVQKYKDALVKEKNAQVSDSQAKVIEVQQIVLSDADTASQVLTSVQESPSQFLSIAEQNSESESITVSVARGQLSEKIESTIFALGDDEISGIIYDEDKYYIFKCTNSYDVERTAARKKQLEIQVENACVSEAIEEYLVDKYYVIDDEKWNEVVDGIFDTYVGEDMFAYIEGMLE